KSREYQRQDITADGNIGGGKARAAAGIGLYAGAAAQRANAKDAVEAENAIAQAREQGVLAADATVDEDALRKLGYTEDEAREKVAAFKMNESLLVRLDDDKYLAGFGNNGGEEFISFMLSSETLVISGGETWTKWNNRMHTMFEKIQNG